MSPRSRCRRTQQECQDPQANPPRFHPGRDLAVDDVDLELHDVLLIAPCRGSICHLTEERSCRPETNRRRTHPKRPEHRRRLDSRRRRLHCRRRPLRSRRRRLHCRRRRPHCGRRPLPPHPLSLRRRCHHRWRNRRRGCASTPRSHSRESPVLQRPPRLRGPNEEIEGNGSSSHFGHDSGYRDFVEGRRRPGSISRRPTGDARSVHVRRHRLFRQSPTIERGIISRQSSEAGSFRGPQRPEMPPRSARDGEPSRRALQVVAPPPRLDGPSARCESP